MIPPVRNLFQIRGDAPDVTPGDVTRARTPGYSAKEIAPDEPVGQSREGSADGRPSGAPMKNRFTISLTGEMGIQ